MKLEKISDTQIRCTLNKEDLMDRELRISELAYGSDKAKQLFRDMMQQAAYEFGFEAEDIPLMIEATPVSADCLVLVITKVEDPDELDTRFSNFTPYGSNEDEEEEDEEEEEDAYADEILNCFEHLGELLGKRDKETASEEEYVTKRKEPEKQPKEKNDFVQLASSLYKIFTFRNLSEITTLSKIIAPIYDGNNTLYKNPMDQKYFLVVHISKHSPEDFNKVCNMISEFGRSEKTNYASTSYYKEHFQVIIAEKAIQKLSVL